MDDMFGILRMLLPINDDYHFDVEVVRESIKQLGYTSTLYPNNPNRFHVQLNTDVPLHVYEKNKRLILALKKRFDASNTFNECFGEYLRRIDNSFNEV